MKRLRIIADDNIPFLKGVMEPYVDIIYLPGAKITALDIKDADALFTRTRTKCNESLLKNSSVKLIATATIGYDHVDTTYCDATGIHWINAPGCNSGSVQQYISAVITTIVSLQRRNFQDLTIGIVGVGNVGSKVAHIANLLGMRVLLNDPPRSDREGSEAFTSLEQLLAESDIVTCHTPLTKYPPYPTYHLASDDFFNKMKIGAVFINTSRGPVSDTKALKRAIKSTLSDYILDVWEGEPFPDASLLADAFIGTPHIAGYSADGKANGTAACIHAFCEFFGLDALKSWYPTSIPPPPMPVVFSLDGSGKKPEQIIYEVITHTYPIFEDSARLKVSPETFEKQRDSYWIRREFKNFSIQLKNVNPEVLNTLKQLGFKLLPMQ